jgi:hypothetical protein
MAVKPEMSANITVAILRSDSMDVLFSPTGSPSYNKKRALSDAKEYFNGWLSSGINYKAIWLFYKIKAFNLGRVNSSQLAAFLAFVLDTS